MALYRLTEEPGFTAPVLVAALEGWVDAGGAGTTAAGQLAESGTVVATFDADAIYDYRVRRPTLDIVDGRPLTLEWPALTLTATTVDGRELTRSFDVLIDPRVAADGVTLADLQEQFDLAWRRARQPGAEGVVDVPAGRRDPTGPTCPGRPDVR